MFPSFSRPLLGVDAGAFAVKLVELRRRRNRPAVVRADARPVIPDTAAEKPMQGEVVATGNGKIQDNGDVRPLDVKAGDRVLFGKYSGTEIKIDGEELLVMREDDIMGVVE